MGILDTVGNTPMVELEYFEPEGVKIFAKLEGNNPAGSIKDRIAVAMIEAAEREGFLKPGGVVVEATSGNTGIGLAFVSAVKGYKCIIVMPENMSEERIKLLKHFGADVVLTPASEGIAGAVRTAEQIQIETPGAFMPDQFTNPANPAIHREITGPEIARQLNSAPSAFVAGVGSGGTITGIAQYFKLDLGAQTQIVAVEPAESPVLSGGKPGPHGIQGIGAGFVPAIYDPELVDSVEVVSTDESVEMAREIARQTGIGCGISSGANLAAAIRIASKLPKNSTVVTVFPDRVDRYLSVL